MKQVIVLFSGQFQGTASLFLKEFEKLGARPDALLCIQPNAGKNYFLTKTAKAILQLFSPGLYKRILVNFICKIRGFQTLSSLRSNWSERGENSWDLLAKGMDIFSWSAKQNIPLHFESALLPGKLKILAGNKPTLFVFYCGGLLTSAHLSVENAEFLNSHMGDMPRYRGMNVLEWAILEEQAKRVSVMVMNEKIDGGEIVTKMDIPVDGIHRIADLRKRGYEYCAKAMAIGVKNYSEGKTQVEPQPKGSKYYYRMHDSIREMLHKKLQTLIN